MRGAVAAVHHRHDEIAAQAVKEKKRLLFEGANAVLLDVDHGTVPYVTSSNCGTGLERGDGAAGKGGGHDAGDYQGIFDARGIGAVPDGAGQCDRRKNAGAGNEYGTTTGRPRRCGWIDRVALRYSIAISGLRWRR